MKSTVKLLITAVLSLFLQCQGQVILLDKSQTFDVGPGDRHLLSVDFGSDSYTRVKETLVIHSNLVSSLGPVHVTAVSLDKSRGWKLEDRDISAVTLCVDKVSATDKPSVSLMIDNSGSKSSARVNVTVALQSLSMLLDKAYRHEVTPHTPVTYLVEYGLSPEFVRRDRLSLLVEDADGRMAGACMAVAVYNQECPLKDLPDNYEFAQMYALGLSNVAMTIRTDKFEFSRAFYVSVLVLPDDAPCHTLPRTFFEDEAEPSKCSERHSWQPRLTSDKNSKNVTITLKKLGRGESYIKPIVIYLAVVVLIGLVGVLSMAGKTYKDTNTTQEVPSEANRLSDVPEESPRLMNGNAAETHEDIVPANNVDAQSAAPADETDGRATLLRKWSKNNHDWLEAKKQDLIVPIGMLRMKRTAKLDDMMRLTASSVWFRRTRSKIYAFLVPLISLFYFIPSVQFVSLAKQTEEISGSKNFCFHNFRCSKPLLIFTDFNHIISNLSYVIFGTFFLIIVKMKPVDNKTDHLADKGVMQQLSIYYGMGMALIMQGFLSCCYHTCPTNLSLQFDTTMMYVICILGYLKIYQFRHPDATISAFATFALLGLLVMLEAVLLYTSNIFFFFLFWVTYVILFIFWAIDQYYLGMMRLVKAKEWMPLIFSRCRRTKLEDESSGPKITPEEQNSRYHFAIIFLVINIVIAVWILIRRVVQERESVSHSLLFILGGNLAIYLCYYTFMKAALEYKDYALKKRPDSNPCETNNPSVTINSYELCYKNPRDFLGYLFKPRFRWQLKLGRVKLSLRSPFASGTVFTILAMIMGVVAMFFYTSRNADRNCSAAESRNLNAECPYFDFFDNHDLWHLFSGAGIFMAFQALLTVDDNLMTVPRNEIPVI